MTRREKLLCLVMAVLIAGAVSAWITANELEKKNSRHVPSPEEVQRFWAECQRKFAESRRIEDESYAMIAEMKREIDAALSKDEELEEALKRYHEQKSQRPANAADSEALLEETREFLGELDTLQQEVDKAIAEGDQVVEKLKSHRNGAIVNEQGEGSEQ